MKPTGLALCALLAAAPLQAADPPSRFSHKLHVQAEELECRDCHAQARKSTRAADNLNPGKEACLDCHDTYQVQMSWPAVAREYAFSHQRHVEELGLDCAACHADMENMDQTTAAALPSMDGCMTCHNGTAAPRECESCHSRPVSSLVPADHGPGWQRQHGRQARISDASCLPCHATSDCQECHEVGALLEVAAKPGGRQPPFAPELAGTRGLSLQRVHGLNFRFTHALEARAKRSECVTCHELDSGDFCAECHNPALNPDLRPVWHGGALWGALAGGVGTGGGRHAELARRDLDNCIACHDVQGQDPTCLLCHVDRTPGRGNDPRTHASSFAADAGEGDFHEDDAALCFTCHLHRGEAGGDGFCGYCHGGK